MSESESQVPPAVDPIYTLNKGGGVTSEVSSRTSSQLIQTEWTIIDALLAMAEKTHDDNKKAFYYQTLMGHVRTLSMLLKEHSAPEQNQDLAKILAEITKDARTKAKRLKQK
jgi:hypothetical protein